MVAEQMNEGHKPLEPIMDRKKMKNLYFTVDSALLRELGERLIGKPYIALAELVKNSYDADATRVLITFDQDKGQITVADNGHGMDLDEFKSFWMRIGSEHKQQLRISRNFKRPMTGSKGIGRLAVQYLAAKLVLTTVSENNPRKRLKAQLDWEKAIKSGDLTKAYVQYITQDSSRGFQKGTEIMLTQLKDTWNAEFIRRLAREIWWLQPPFRRSPETTEDRSKAFEIQFLSPEKDYETMFDQQMHAIMEIWYARLVGRNDNGKVIMSLEFKGEKPVIEGYTISDCRLKNGDFEIRIYSLVGHAPEGIKVGEAREYLMKNGGVHVYDGGFHLPYYGDPKNDWLKIELDHARRLTLSDLLPPEYRIKRGLQFLPTLSRILGIVNVNTSKEKNELNIMITRDRLQENKAFDDLFYMVRWALDYYAYKEKLKSLQKEESGKEVEKPKREKIEQVLDDYRAEIPKETYAKLKDDMEKVADEIETEAESAAKTVGLMGSLATAGVSALAVQHETNRQFRAVEEIVRSIGEIVVEVKEQDLKQKLERLRDELSTWIERAKAMSGLFSYFSNADVLKTRARYPAKRTVEEIYGQVMSLARGIPIDCSGVDERILLPPASLVEWTSIFQNVFTNAFNALLDSERKLIAVTSRVKGRVREILVQDTGCGIDLKEADTLFEPFERKIEISPERRGLGYGGMGLGLTIVRLIAHSIGCTVSFVEAETGFKTAFCIRWREKE